MLNWLKGYKDMPMVIQWLLYVRDLTLPFFGDESVIPGLDSIRPLLDKLDARARETFDTVYMASLSWSGPEGPFTLSEKLQKLLTSEAPLRSHPLLLSWVQSEPPDYRQAVAIVAYMRHSSYRIQIEKLSSELSFPHQRLIARGVEVFPLDQRCRCYGREIYVRANIGIRKTKNKDDADSSAGLCEYDKPIILALHGFDGFTLNLASLVGWYSRLVHQHHEIFLMIRESEAKLRGACSNDTEVNLVLSFWKMDPKDAMFAHRFAMFSLKHLLSCFLFGPNILSNLPSGSSEVEITAYRNLLQLFKDGFLARACNDKSSYVSLAGRNDLKFDDAGNSSGQLKSGMRLGTMLARIRNIPRL